MWGRDPYCLLTTASQSVQHNLFSGVVSPKTYTLEAGETKAVLLIVQMEKLTLQEV